MKVGRQTTLRDQAVLNGIGVHSGLPVTLILHPAEAMHGDLGVCLTVDLEAEIFDALPDGGGQDACEVTDVSGWSRERADPFGRQKAYWRKDQNNNGKPT